MTEATHMVRVPDGQAPALGESRSRVLAILQESGRPLSVPDVAEQVRLHNNTVRFHLDGLVEDGLVDRSVEERDRPGRPRTLYTARPGGTRAGQRSYHLLAQILTSYLEAKSDDPHAAALESGKEWGHFVAQRPPPFRKVDAATAREQLMTTLDDIGFAPEEGKRGRQHIIKLHQCPFREIALEHRDVVCAVHLGLMRGVLDEIDAPIQAQTLDSFVEPSLCVTHLASRKSTPKRSRSARARRRAAG